MTEKNGLKTFCGSRVVIVTLKDNRDFMTFGVLADVKDGFLLINVDHRGPEFIAISAVKRIELPRSGRTLTPERPPWNSQEGE